MRDMLFGWGSEWSKRNTKKHQSADFGRTWRPSHRTVWGSTDQMGYVEGRGIKMKRFITPFLTL